MNVTMKTQRMRLGKSLGHFFKPELRNGKKVALREGLWA